MMRGASTLRLFVAVYPPAETVSALLAALDALGLGASGRVRDAQVHMTLQFIGDTPERDLPEIQESMERAAAGIPEFELRPIRLMTLPQGPRPRLIAAETDSPPPLQEARRRLAQRLARNLRERDRFHPHLTLHRFKSPSPPVEVVLTLAPFRVSHILLMRSILRPAGAEHAEICRAALEPFTP
jgi:2'-5' RNA ligase